MARSISTVQLIRRHAQVQTPQQRRANERFAKKEESKMGTFRPPKADKETRRKTELSKQFRGSNVSLWIVCSSLCPPLLRTSVMLISQQMASCSCSLAASYWSSSAYSFEICILGM